MNKKYRQLWVLLRKRITDFENNEERLLEREVYHAVLTMMTELEAKATLEE